MKAITYSGHKSRSSWPILLGLAILFRLGSPAIAESYYWNASSGNWEAGSNWWGGTAPSGSDSNAFIGADSGVNQTAIISSGTWGIHDLLVGAGTGTGTLQVNGGSVSFQYTYLGLDAGSTGTVTISSGTWSNENFGAVFRIGLYGTGILNLAGEGVMTLDNGVGLLTLAQEEGSVGTFNFGTGSAAGTLNAAEVTGGAGAARVNFNHTGTSTFAAALTGNLSVNKEGEGTTILTGNNTYTGATTITNGTLQFGDGGVTGSVAGDITNNSHLAFNRADDLTVNAAISGSGDVTHLGWNTLTLTGNNSYTGTTTINNGTLQIGEGGVTGSVAGDIANNSHLIFNRLDDLAFAGAISGSGDVTKLGAGTLTLSGHPTYRGATFVNEGSLLITGQIGYGDAYNVAGGASLLGDAILNRDVIISEGGALASSLIIRGILTLPGSAQVSVGDVTAETVTADSGKMLLVNNAAGGSIDASPGSAHIANLNGASLTTGNWGASVDTLTSGNVSTNGGSLVAFSGAFSGSISGSGCLIKAEDGLLSLGNSNEYSGGTMIRSGTLQIGEGGASGSVAGDIANNSHLVFNRADDLTYDGAISGSGDVAQSGGGTLTLTGSASHSGGTAVNSGVLQIGDGGSAGSVTGDIVNNSHLAFNRSDDISYAGIVSGSGDLTKLGGGLLSLTGNSTYTGATIVGNGTLQIGNGGATGSVAGDVTNNSHLVFNRSNDLTYAGSIGGSGDVTKLGIGRLTLTGNSTHSGTTSVSNGSLQLGDGGTSGSVTGDIANNSHLVFNRSDDLTYAGTISGSGDLTKLGLGTLTLSGNHTYAGATFVTQGSLLVSGQIGFGDALDVASGASLDGNGMITRDVVIDEGGWLSPSLTIRGSVTLPVSAQSSIGDLTEGAVAADSGKMLLIDSAVAGSIDASAGTAHLGNLNGASLTTGNWGATVETLNSGNITTSGGSLVAKSGTFNGTIGGSGGLVKSGDGLLSLQTENSYTGGTIITGGTLQLGNTGALGGATNAMTMYGGVLDLNSNGNEILIGSLSGSEKAVILNHSIIAAAFLTVNQTADGIFAGSIQDSISQDGYPDIILTKTGAGTLTLSGSNTYSGPTILKSGTLQIAGGGSLSNRYQMFVGDASGDNAALLISGGGITDASGNAFCFIGNSAGSVGLATMTGGAWDSSQITVGAFGTGTLNISGGTVTDSGATLGLYEGSSGTATITGGTWNNSGMFVGASGAGTLNINGGLVTVHLDGYRTEIQVGNSATGTLNINGGTLENDNGVLGYWQGATGTATVNSGTWNNSGDLKVGRLGNGTLDISGGLVTDTVGYLGWYAGSNGAATISSGTWNNTDDWGLYVGYQGNGTLNLTGNGVVNIGGGTGWLWLAQQESSTGTLNLGMGETAGTLNAAVVYGHPADAPNFTTATVNFNHSGSYTFSPDLAGNLVVHKLGDGTTILTGIHSNYTGQTFVEQGTLQINGHSGDLNIFGQEGAINVSSGAVLTGNGLIERNVNVSEGGSLAGTLTIHGLVTLPESFRQSVGDLGSGTAIADGEKVLMINHATGGSIDASAGSASIATLDGASLTTGNWGATVETLNSGVITTHGGSLVALAGDFTGSIGGSGCLIKMGSGLLTLETSNTYTGGTVITGGTLEVRTNNAVSSVSTSGVLVFAPGILRIDEGVQLNTPVYLRGGGIEHGMAAGSSLKDVISATSHLEGGNDTTLQVLGGATSGATTIRAAFYSTLGAGSPTNDAGRTSDILSFNGTGADPFVLQLSLASISSDRYLGWYNPTTNAWVNAVDGNQTGTSNATGAEIGYQGSFASFQQSYGSDINDYIGAWGTDVSGHAAWAVINHNSSFAIVPVAVAAVPEPSEWAMLSAGAALLWVGNRRRKSFIQ